MRTSLRARRPRLLAVLLTCLAVVVPIGLQTTTPDPADARTLIWSDEFAGAAGSAPSAKNWSHQTGGKGWGNKELQCYTDSRRNSALNGKGQLVITARRVSGHTCADGSKNSFTSARLRTKDLREQKYGYIEIRAKIPSGKGVWPAFWALGADDDQRPWPHSGEFDMLEYIGRSPKQLHYNVHGVDARGKHKYIQLKRDLRRSPADAWHTYGVRWTSTSFTYYYDGKRIGSLTTKDAKKAGLRWAFAKPYYFVLNLSMGGSWPGPVDGRITSRQLVVDWVRVYE